jgi:CelD/BcsL family acetyltransferase involved in cellulose biosynthesis
MTRTQERLEIGQFDIQTLEDLADIWHKQRITLQWTCPFVLPPWLMAWWGVFGHGSQSLIAVVRHGQSILGIAPCMLKGKTVRFLGSPDICDYFDCVVAPGKEQLFFTSLFSGFSAQGFKHLELGPVPPDSVVQRFFSKSEMPHESELGVFSQGVVLQLDLPASWDAFLQSLSGKERHELRRKLRRLHQAGRIRFRCIVDVEQVPEALGHFLRLFTMNREDKAAFMTGPVVSFFRALAFGLAKEGLLKLFLLDVDERPVASVFCFDYLGTRYLYNNGYDDAYRSLSVGLLSKVLSLKSAIEDGLHTYNFLKGKELYKQRLGGKEISLKTYRIKSI